MRPAAALAALLLAACTSGTGVLIDVQGALALDTLRVTVTLDGGAPITRSAPSSSLPTSYLAILPDSTEPVTVTVTALLGGQTVAAATAPELTVHAHQIAHLTVQLGGGDGGAPDAGADGGFTLARGGDPPSGATITGAWGSSSGDVYFSALAAGGVNVLHTTTEGASFTASSAGAGDLYAVWGADDAHVFLAGAAGAVLHGSGASFTADTTPAGSNTLYALWGSSATDVYAVGAGNTVLHAVTGGWVLQTAVGATVLRGVWGSDAAHVWAVGSGGAILFSTGDGVWSAQSSGTSSDLYAISGCSATELYAVGDAGTLLRSDGGGTWSPVSAPTSEHLGAAFCAGGNAWIAGDAWAAARSSGGAFTPVPTGLAVDAPSADRLDAIWGTAAGELYIAGAGQTILHLP